MKVSVSTAIKRSGRVQQVEGMFDVPPSEQADLEWELPDELVAISEDPDWSIGLIVGPSGTGKTTIARELWPKEYVQGFHWPEDRAVVDAIEGPIKEVVQTLTAVGFGSPPAWLRPYQVLSTGEQFRASAARALLERPGAVLDEFTSVVDRQVAKVGSHAVQKAVRRRRGQLVAVTCHFDVIEWLQPDWMYRPDTNAFDRRRLQRHPALDLEIRRVAREAWPLFRHHHYLSGDLHVAATCYGAFTPDEECVAFVATYPFPHPKTREIVVNHRTVVLPDWQGLGIGGRMDDFIGQLLHREGKRFRTTLAHPALIAYFRHSQRWQEVGGKNLPSRSRKPKRLTKQHASARKLATRTFEYLPI